MLSLISRVAADIVFEPTPEEILGSNLGAIVPVGIIAAAAVVTIILLKKARNR